MPDKNHEKALDRLGEAQREEEHRLDERDAAQGTAGEFRAENDLRRAQEETAARGRWLAWVGSDPQTGNPNEPALEEITGAMSLDELWHDPRESVDLQREADGERSWTIHSNEGSQRLERFRQGDLDRWGRPANAATDVADFYTESP
jgi:hypothetical protein